MYRNATLLAAAGLLLAAPALARDSLGVFSEWGAFRDPGVPRCYAIAKPQTSRQARNYDPYATIGTWPKRRVRGQVHFRLSRELGRTPNIRLVVGEERFQLTGGGGDAWATGRAMDAAIVAAMRSAGRMSISATDKSGRRFTDSYDLGGVATAMDAATVGCS